MLRFVVLRAAGFLVLLTSPGCSGDSRRQVAPVVRRDSAGVELVLNAEPAWSDATRWRLDTAAAIRLAAPGIDLYQVTDAVALHGALVVANSGTNQLLYFDTTGTFRFSRGREGSGPGDFRGMGWMQACDDSLIAVHDARNLRLVWWSADGVPLRQWRRPLRSGGTSVRPPGVLPDCSALLQAYPDGEPAERTEVRRDTMTLARLELDSGAVLDTVFRYERAPWYRYAERGAIIEDAVPFAKRPFAFVLEDVIVHGDGAEFAYRVYGRDGTLRRIVRRADDRSTPVPADSIAAYKARQMDDVEDDDFRRLLATAFDGMPYPTHAAPWDTAGVDAGGNLWIRERWIASPAWAVFDTSGRWLGHVEVPAGWWLEHIDERWVVARWLDEDDVEHLVLVPLVKP